MCNVCKVLMEQGNQDSCNSYPDMHPEPVLHLPWEVACETTTQCIASSCKDQHEGNDTEGAERVIEWPGKLLCFDGREVPGENDSIEDDASCEPEPPCFRKRCFPDS